MSRALKQIPKPAWEGQNKTLDIVQASVLILRFNQALEDMKAIHQDLNQDVTRTKLIQAAGEVFAEVGYRAATTREICRRAGANVAAVNYHFGDKLALYTEILKAAVIRREQPAVEALLAAKTPEEALRAFLFGIFWQLTDPDRPAWYVKVMAHELANPTPGLAAVVEHVIRPNVTLLCTIVGRIIGRPPQDMKTRMCVHSIIAQVIHYIHGRPVIALLWPDWKMTQEAIKEIADHIAEFSIVALNEIGKSAHPAHAQKSATRRLK